MTSVSADRSGETAPAPVPEEIEPRLVDRRLVDLRLVAPVPAAPALSRAEAGRRPAADLSRVGRVLRTQDGVIRRPQLIAAGLSRHDIAGLLDRGQLARVHPGVYVNHTGPPTPSQLRWAAVLACWPAALSHETALGGRGGGDAHVRGPLHVAVDRHRRVVPPDGVVVHRLTDFGDRVLNGLSPPRLRVEDAVLLAASAARCDVDAVAVLARACGSGQTHPDRLGRRLQALSRLPRRAWLAAVIDDVSTGSNSVLEHGYLVRVERPHGLPVGLRQDRVAGTTVAYRDVRHSDHDTLVELDGRLNHDDPERRADDLDRDLASAALRAEETLRVGWRQAFATAWVTAARVGAVLSRRGWAGEVRACPDCPR